YDLPQLRGQRARITAGVDDERREILRALRVWDVGGRRGRLVQRAIPCVADDANDLEQHAVWIGAKPELSAERFLAWPGLPGQPGRQDRHRAIAIVECK